MNVEQRYIALSMFSGIYCSFFVSAYTMGWLEPYFHGMIRNGDYARKFYFDFAPHPLWTRFAWFTFWSLLTSGHIFLYKLASKVPVFEKKFYLAYTCAMFGSSLWFFLFGYEKLATMAVVLALLTVCTYIMLIAALRRRANVDGAYPPIPEESRWWFDRCVIDGTAIFLVWYTYSVFLFGGTAVLYKEGPSEIANLRGLIDPDTCTLAGICCFIFATSVLMFLDLFVFPDYTKHVHVGYFTTIYVCLGVVLSICVNRKDFHPNARIMMGYALATFLVWRKRTELQNKFGRHVKSQ